MSNLVRATSELLRTDLANALQGAGLVAFDDAVAYGAGTTGAELLAQAATAAGHGVKLQALTVPGSYGAVADGVTDDAAALQAAVNAAAGGVLTIPRGMHLRIGSAINIAAPITIRGHGAKLSTGAAHVTALNITAGGVRVEGLEIEGAGNAAYNTNGRLIVVQGTDGGAGVAPTRIRGVVITGCTLREAGRAAIRAQFVERLRIVDNDLSECAYAGVELLSCNDVTVRGNDIRDVTPGTGGNSYGVYVSQTNAADTVRHPPCSKVTVTGNTLENIAWEGIDCHGGDRLDFSHNTLINCGDQNAAIAIIHGDDEVSTPIHPATNVRVIGNAIVGAQQYAIALSSGSASVVHKNIVIEGNTLENCGTSATVNDVGGIRIGAARNVAVRGNVLDYCAPYGVVVNSQYAAGVVIEGNTFRRIVSNTESTPAAILVDRGATGNGALIIGGNALVLAGTGETYEAVAGVRVVSTDGGNIRILENAFDAAATKYSLSAVQAAGMSSPVVNFGEDSIAVTTAVASASKVITMPKPHSGNTLYSPRVAIWRATGNEKTIAHVARTAVNQITVTVRNADGGNFPANGSVDFYWRTEGY